MSSCQQPPTGSASGRVERPGSAVPPSSLLARLPAYYREEPGLLAALLEGAAELLRESLDALHGREASVLRELGVAGPAGPSRARGAAGSGAFGGERQPWGEGTPGWLRAWLVARVGSVPRMHAGLRLAERAAGWLVYERSPAPAVLLTWERRELSAPPPGFEIPAGLLPPATSVQAALLARYPPRRLSMPGSPPLPGERAQGVVFWASPASLMRGRPSGEEAT